MLPQAKLYVVSITYPLCNLHEFFIFLFIHLFALNFKLSSLSICNTAKIGTIILGCEV